MANIYFELHQTLMNFFRSDMNSLKSHVEYWDVESSFETNSIHRIKYQDIIYYKYDRDETVKPSENIHIDFFKAMHEMEKLDWTFKKNYIGFDNKRKEEMVQAIRIDKNKWYADVPINSKKDWDGYYWAAYSDNKTISNMMKLFFEELPWFGMLAWKMKRYLQ